MTKILNEIRQHGFFFSSESSGNDSFPITPPPGEVFLNCQLTILDTHFGGSARVISQPALGQPGPSSLVIAWQCDVNAEIKYQLEAYSGPAGAAPVVRQMTGFQPSRDGWPFDNAFESIPPFKLIGELKFGDASKGLCGGMVYAALDYYLAGLGIPEIPPADLSPHYHSPVRGPIFDYFAKRLFTSFDIPTGVWSYVELMHPDFPDFQSSRRFPGTAPRSRSWRMVRQEWPAIKEKLDMGQPCPLGLVRIKSTDLTRLSENHQVLAYGYELSGDDLTLYIYDPNFHAYNYVTMKLNIANPERRTNVKYWDDKPVYCFFQTKYNFSMPPGEGSLPGRIILFEDENFCGRSIDVNGEHPDLSRHKAGNFNNRTSSFVILTGHWNFFNDAGYKTPFLHNKSPLVLGPGNYARVSLLGIQDNEITSLKAVKV